MCFKHAANATLSRHGKDSTVQLNHPVRSTFSFLLLLLQPRYSVPTLLLTKNSRTFQNLHNIFPGLFRSLVLPSNVTFWKLTLLPSKTSHWKVKWLKNQQEEGKGFLSQTIVLTFQHWLRGPAVEHRSLAGVLSLSCARPVADG